MVSEPCDSQPDTSSGAGSVDAGRDRLCQPDGSAPHADRRWLLACARGDITSDRGAAEARRMHATEVAWCERDPALYDALTQGDLRWPDNARRYLGAEEIAPWVEGDPDGTVIRRVEQLLRARLARRDAHLDRIERTARWLGRQLARHDITKADASRRLDALSPTRTPRPSPPGWRWCPGTSPVPLPWRRCVSACTTATGQHDRLDRGRSVRRLEHRDVAATGGPDGRRPGGGRHVDPRRRHGLAVLAGRLDDLAAVGPVGRGRTLRDQRHALRAPRARLLGRAEGDRGVAAQPQEDGRPRRPRGDHVPARDGRPAGVARRRRGPPPGEVVACANGLLHVTTRELYDHDPRYFTRVAVPFAYEPDGSDPERWLTFLDELWRDDAEAVAAMQEWFGYVISGRIDPHKILLLVGPIRSGKGTIARVLTALVGRPNVAGPTLASLGTNFGMSPLLAKTLAVVSDARLGAGSDTVVERLLSISGEDAITVDRKYREPWTGHLGTRFVIISNELPNFGDASGAIASRFVVLEARQSWFGRENVRLTGELYAELPGILRWALDGLDRLTETNRFTAVSSSADAIAALADMVSSIGAFVRECCLVGPAFEAPVRQLYEAWKGWCARNGHYHAGTLQTFGRDLRAVAPGLRVVQHRVGEHRHRWFTGLGLAASNETPR